MGKFPAFAKVPCGTRPYAHEEESLGFSPREGGAFTRVFGREHAMGHLLAAEGGAGTYLDWGVVHIALANALIILIMLVIFVAALLVPFPRPKEEPARRPDAEDSRTAGP
jgi:hypothetical protein